MAVNSEELLNGHLYDTKELYDTCKDRYAFLAEIGRVLRAERKLQKKIGERPIYSGFAGRL